MKKLLLFLFLGGMLTAANAQQLPNYGFDSWKSSCASTESFGDYNEMRQRPGVEPTDWNGSSVNQAVKILGKQEKKQQLVYNDNNTVKMVNTFVGALGIGSVAPGFINLGTPWVYATKTVKKCDGGVYGGISFSHKPDAITGRYKRTDATGENSRIIVYLWNGTFTSKVGEKGSPSINRDNVDKAIMGMVDASAKGTLVASCDYEFTSTTNKDWQTITVPLTYVSAASPAMVNAIISGGDYWNRDNMQENTTLYADDVRFVYYSTLNTLSYNGSALTVPAAGATLDMSSVVYDPAKLAYTLNGQTAEATTSYDDNSGLLTITVSNVDKDIDGQSIHTYYVQFAHVHGNFKYTANGTGITVSCGKCGENLGTISMVLPTDLIYNGKAKAVTLTGAVEGMDAPAIVYSSGSAPVNVGAYTASITMGDATATAEFAIKAKDIAGATVGKFAAMTYTGKAQIPAATVTVEGLGEVTGAWSAVTNVVDKTTFTANGNYTGTISGVATGMQAKDIAGATVGEFAAMTYNGTAQTPVATVTIEGIGEVTGAWSTVTNVTDKTTFTANGNFAGTIANKVTGMQAKDIAGATVGAFAPMTYTGKAQTPSATVTLDGWGAVTGAWAAVTGVTDKTTFTANGNYTGTISNVACGMQAKDIAGATVGAFAPMTYTGKAQTPVATVTLDGMGEVTGTWAAVTGVADKTTFTASGNYTGAISNVACGMQAKDIAGATVGAFAPMTYTGKAQTPVAAVTLDGMGEVTGTWAAVTNVADKTTFTASGNYTGAISNVACGMQTKDIAEAIVGKFAQMTYTGQPQMPEAIVTLEGYGIVSGTWEAVTNIADKTAFTANGNYSGVISDVACGMQAKDIAGAQIGEFAPMTYTGEAQMPAAMVTLDGFGEVTGSWSEVLNVGDKTTFTASGNYVGALTVVAQMTPLTVAVVSAKVEDVAFDADGEYTLVVTDVVFDAVELAAGVDYTAEAQLVGENVEGATSEVLITFTMLNANYALAANTLSTTVTLLQHEHEWQYAADGASILATCKDTDSNCPAKVANITLQAPADAVYSGTAKAVTLVGNYPGLAKLQELITYSGDCIDAGRYVASISYEGVEATLEFEILPKDITDEAVVGEFAPMTYTGEPQMPAAAVTLEGYGEITGAWSEVVNVDDVATFTANGNYTGTVSVVTGMSPAELTQPVVEGIVESYEYTGNTIEPKVTVMNGETLLVEDVDYVVTYSDNVEAGVGTVLITFIGNYSGTLTLTFEIIDTAIEDILTDEVKVCYDLYGRRVQEPLKGELYIVNGKKVRW